MAFTAEQKLSIVRILGITPPLLDAHILSLGATLTTAIELAVADELERWETAGVSFVKLHPRESNKGVETNPDAAKADIKRNIAFLLELSSAVPAYGMGTLQIGL